MLLKHSGKYRNICFFYVLSLALSLPSYARVDTKVIPLFKNALSEKFLKQYPILPYNFIDLLRVTPKLLPVKLKNIQKIFNNQLRIVEQSENSVSYILGSYRTLDGVIVKDVGVKIRLKAGWKVVGFGFDLDQKQCVNTKLLKKEFGFIIPELLSFHPVANAPIALHTTNGRGIFVMGITADYPDCATNIGIGMFNSKKEQQEWKEYVRKNAPYLRARERQKELEEK
ncbi:hypothetical protein COMX_05760 [Commensalibacter papalotli (ex Servin-Garciduenas et al. 2014)]|uniref:Uncharacterized protein n=2 Tax=Commensalibacter TaxID=1079922 RepID=W7DPE0_9PROT|nr:hypothetical protein COMX_05760 [Commensalibacter papalotli (ex Servin-Garciduenas et al. 2014)]